MWGAPVSGAQKGKGLSEEDAAKEAARKRYTRDKFGSRKGHEKYTFMLRHFAGTVTYNCKGWLVKNSDQPSTDILEAVASAHHNHAIGEMLKHVIEPKMKQAAKTRQASSISKKFVSDLKKLLDKVGGMQSHFIRCIKPNETSRPGHLQHGMVYEQLVNCGVLECVRIRANGKIEPLN